MNALIPRGRKGLAGEWRSEEKPGGLDRHQAAGLRYEAACRGFESAVSGGAKDQRAGQRFSKASKQQARNVDLGMVARRAGSHCERAKGRCERPTPDRKHLAGGLVSIEPSPSKDGRGE